MSLMYLAVVVVVVLLLPFAWRLVTRVSSVEARRLVDHGAYLLDLQERTAFRTKHLPRAQNIPLVELSRRLREVGNHERPVVIYGSGSITNGVAARILRSAGFRHVHDLGPMSRWN